MCVYETNHDEALEMGLASNGHFFPVLHSPVCGSQVGHVF